MIDKAAGGDKRVADTMKAIFEARATIVMASSMLAIKAMVELTAPSK